MNFRQKSKKYGKWAFVKYKGDLAIYSVCQHCGYTYPCYEYNHPFRTEPSTKKLYRYCPSCGLKMNPYNGEHIYIEGKDFE